jgi:hypothetical protein
LLAKRAGRTAWDKRYRRLDMSDIDTKPPENADSPPASKTTLDEESARRESWVAAFGRLYCSREHCTAAQGREVAELMYPAMELLDCLQAVEIVRGSETGVALRRRWSTLPAADSGPASGRD